MAGVPACWLHLGLFPQAHGFVPKLIDCGFAHLLTEEQAAEQAKGKCMFTMGSTARGVIGTQVLTRSLARSSLNYNYCDWIWSLLG